MNFSPPAPIQCDSPRAFERALADLSGQRQVLLNQIVWINKHIEELQELLLQSKQLEL